MMENGNNRNGTVTEGFETAHGLAPAELLRNAISNGLSAAAWRLPGQNEIQLLLTEDPLEISDITLETLKPGFLCSRFRTDLPKIFLPADFLATWIDDRINVLKGEIPELSSNGSNQKKESTAAVSPYIEHAAATAYERLVNQCLKSIASGAFEKLVPARTRMVEVTDEADPVSFFLQLTEAYPNAFVSVVCTPSLGLWIGASPEPLISIDRNHTFRTVALAGTKPFDPSVAEHEVAWTQKEIEEQALVERYIISCFKTIRLREYEEYGPKTYRAGNLLHLRSVFEVNMDAVRFPDLGSVMLKLLHPTSAVCGMPGKEAMEFLLHEEGIDREMFAGYIGPVNIGLETHLFVNIRCLKWMGNQVQLFAGAGVTSGSIASSEYSESGLKMDTLLRHLPIVSSKTD